MTFSSRKLNAEGSVHKLHLVACLSVSVCLRWALSHPDGRVNLLMSSHHVGAIISSCIVRCVDLNQQVLCNDKCINV